MKTRLFFFASTIIYFQFGILFLSNIVKIHSKPAYTVTRFLRPLVHASLLTLSPGNLSSLSGAYCCQSAMQSKTQT